MAPADSRAGAISYGRALLASLHLPPGARTISKPVISMPGYSQPAKPIDGLTPFSIPAILTDMIDIGVVYHVSPSMAGDYSYLLAHRPAGTTLSANGYSSHSGIVTTEFVCNVPATLPAGIYSADLETSFQAVHGSGSLVRADAVIAWYPPRSPADYIDPERYASVTLSHRTNKFDKTRVLTSPAAVAAWAALVNGLRGAPEVMSSGGGIGAINSYEIVFASATGAPTVVVFPTDPLYVSITVGGRAEPSLSPGDVLISRIQQELRR